MTTALTMTSNLSAVLSIIENTVSASTRTAYLQELKSLNETFSISGWNLYPLNDDGELDAGIYVGQLLSARQGASFVVGHCTQRYRACTAPVGILVAQRSWNLTACERTQRTHAERGRQPCR